jgi:hypothetical protein
VIAYEYYENMNFKYFKRSSQSYLITKEKLNENEIIMNKNLMFNSKQTKY